MIVNWVVDIQMFETDGNLNDTLPAIASDPDANLITTRYIPFDDTPYYGDIKELLTSPTILIGTVNYIKKCPATFTPGAWGFNKNTDCIEWITNIPSEWLLNGATGFHFFHSWGWARKNLGKLIENTDGGVFVRPNSGFKTFPGTLFTENNVIDELAGTMKFSSVMDDTLCLLSQGEKINGEYRFVIGAGKVIAGSQYRYLGKLDIRRDYPDEAFDLAEKMAKHSWQPDLVYTCDVAMTEDGPKIIELNSFACAGLYACDKKHVVECLNEIAINEFIGVYD